MSNNYKMINILCLVIIEKKIRNILMLHFEIHHFYLFLHFHLFNYLLVIFLC